MAWSAAMLNALLTVLWLTAPEAAAKRELVRSFAPRAPEQPPPPPLPPLSMMEVAERMEQLRAEANALPDVCPACSPRQCKRKVSVAALNEVSYGAVGVVLG